MRIEINPLLSVTSILNRSGRRVGNYLVDRSKDSLDQEKRQRQHTPDEEAVVFHGESYESQHAVESERQMIPRGETTALNITV